MCNLRWLELNRTNVSRLPDFIGKLKSLVKEINFYFIEQFFCLGKIKFST
jgi:hypothetical protein